MISLSPDIVKQILGGRRQMIRVPARGSKPKEGHAYWVKAKEEGYRAQITITSIAEEFVGSELMWTIRFQRGDTRDMPRIPAARPGLPHGDYVSSAPRSLHGTADEVSEATQARYAAKGRETHAQVLAEQKRRLQAALGVIREESEKNGYGSATTNARLRKAEEQTRAIRSGVVYASPKSRAS